MLPVLLEMKKRAQIESLVCVTAQHRELLDGVLAPFGIVPDFDLNLMTAGQTLTDITTRALRGLEPIFKEQAPDVLLVQGDTATVFAASLAAFYCDRRIKIGHIEAGLRSFDKFQPYPEEINRRLTTVLADFHFAPTQLSRENLLKEGVPDSSVFVTGNTVIDMIRHTRRGQGFNNPALEKVDFSKRVILMTAHRRENWGKPLEDICNAVKRVVLDFPDVQLVWAVHPGRAVTEPSQRILGGVERVLLTEPLDIFDMHNLMSRAYLLLTDSGGLQEESPSFDLPTIVLREVTERPEGLEAGTMSLGGVSELSVYNEARRLLTDEAAYKKMAAAENPYGDGMASKRIIDILGEC
ncbi:MAG: UDP-N-acetylglucosamine 2-epimerase (non-hydrolyzing) [Defluviitaleaceae bacterium]|nr:UDP-N-acetylglucosamine 2-epimerase (non-hydrolyzing) [Defluviitaleaceae bacterium]